MNPNLHFKPFAFSQTLALKMVKIVIAGASGSKFHVFEAAASSVDRLPDVAQEILDGLVAQNKHEILLMSRKVGMPPGFMSAEQTLTACRTPLS